MVSRILQVAALAVVIYAALAGFRTMDDPDLWWQLAAGRHIVTEGSIPRAEVLSYTAKGAPWIYPPLGSAAFYLIYRAGGLNLLSLLSPLAGLGIALLLVWPVFSRAAAAYRNNGWWRVWLAAFAVPAIARTSLVRVNMLTTVLAAVFLTILWDAHLRLAEGTNERPRWLWALPAMMLLWVNVHPGFTYGLLLLIAFAVRWPKQMGLPALAAALATFVNPWGWGIYEAILAQGEIMQFHQSFIGEWTRAPFSWTVLKDSMAWRNPDSSLYWLIGISALGVLIGLLRKHLWGPALIAASAAGAIAFFRFQGLFVLVAAIVVPDLLTVRHPELFTFTARPRITRFGVAVCALLLAFLGVHSWDLITNRFARTHVVMSQFGIGPSSWFPERAAKFIEEHQLPHQLYEDYVMGGYFSWRLAPKYPVFIDGRALPYGPELFFRQLKMARQSPDTAIWREAIDRWHIRTVFISTERFIGYTGAALRAFCESTSFQLAYLDETAAVFVASSDMRVPALSCQTATVTPPPDSTSASTRYHFWADAGALYWVLGRNPESEQAFQQAVSLYDDDPSLYMDIGQLHGREADERGILPKERDERLKQAEAAFRRSIELGGGAVAWSGLADMFAAHGRYDDAIACYQEGAVRRARPAAIMIAMADAQLKAGRPNDAMESVNRALADNPYWGPAEALGQEFYARALIVRGMASLALLRAPEAITLLEQAARIAPPDPQLTSSLNLALADAYLQTGRSAEARRVFEEARQHMPPGTNAATVQRLEWQLGITPER